MSERHGARINPDAAQARKENLVHQGFIVPARNHEADWDPRRPETYTSRIRQGVQNHARMMITNTIRYYTRNPEQVAPDIEQARALGLNKGRSAAGSDLIHVRLSTDVVGSIGASGIGKKRFGLLLAYQEVRVAKGEKFPGTFQAFQDERTGRGPARAYGR